MCLDTTGVCASLTMLPVAGCQSRRVALPFSTALGRSPSEALAETGGKWPLAFGPPRPRATSDADARA